MFIKQLVFSSSTKCINMTNLSHVLQKSIALAVRCCCNNMQNCLLSKLIRQLIHLINDFIFQLRKSMKKYDH